MLVGRDYVQNLLFIPAMPLCLKDNQYSIVEFKIFKLIVHCARRAVDSLLTAYLDMVEKNVSN